MKKFLLVFLIHFASTAQIQIGTDMDGEAEGDRFGNVVSLSADANRLAVSGFKNITNGFLEGYLKVYSKTDGSWMQLGNTVNTTSTSVLSSDGNVLAVGDHKLNEDGIRIGFVKIYQLTDNTWTPIGNDIDGVAASAQNGFNLSISSDGSILAIGDPLNSINSRESGQVRVYQNNSGTWSQIGSTIIGQSARDGFGSSVSLSADGSIVAIGASRNDANGEDAGQVRVFQNNAENWIQIGSEINGEAAGDSSGNSISISADGNILAIGALFNDGNGPSSGHVRIYENRQSNWTQIGLDIDGEAPGDGSGRSVSLSADGTVVAIGAYFNNGNGSLAGHTRVYKNINGSWVQIGNDIDGEAAGDLSGAAVSLSADGTVVAIGATGNDANGNNAGHVRVYDASAVLSSKRLLDSNFMVFPNPVTDQLQINLGKGINLERINIYSALGQLIKTEFSTEFSLAEFAKGSYFFEVITDQGKATKTVVVK